MRRMSFSNTPQVLGLVSMTAATPPSPASASKRSGSTRPRASSGIETTSKPSAAAVAGLVPCAESGTSTRRRSAFAAPPASSAARIAIMPQSSPCAPAPGVSATPGMPVSTESQRCTSRQSASAPCTVLSGWRGWMSAKPGSRAMRSFRRGLCFMVQEPSGKRPVSMP